MKVSQKKSKISKLCMLIGLEDNRVEKDKITPRKSYQVKTLSDLAFDVLSKAMKKSDLNIIYSEYLWPVEIKKWNQDYPVKVVFLSDKNDLNHTEVFPTTSDQNGKISNETEQAGETLSVEEINTATSKDSVNSDEEFWFYSPSYSKTRQQLEIACIDSTHLLTRTRRKCCKGGIEKLSNKPWKFNLNKKYEKGNYSKRTETNEQTNKLEI